MYQEVERRKGSTRRKSTSNISVCLLNSHYLTGINSLGVLSYVADEDDYTGGGHVVETQEEPFGELTLVLLCESQDGCNCCCDDPVHLLIEEEGETLEVIDVQDESFGE